MTTKSDNNSGKRMVIYCISDIDLVIGVTGVFLWNLPCLRTSQFSHPQHLVLTFNLNIFLGLTNSFSEINSFLNKCELEFLKPGDNNVIDWKLNVSPNLLSKSSACTTCSPKLSPWSPNTVPRFGPGCFYSYLVLL